MSNNSIALPEFLTGPEILQIIRSHTRNPRQSLYSLRKRGLPAVYHLGQYVYPAKKAMRFLRSGSRRQLSRAS